MLIKEPEKIFKIFGIAHIESTYLVLLKGIIQRKVKMMASN